MPYWQVLLFLEQLNRWLPPDVRFANGMGGSGEWLILALFVAASQGCIWAEISHYESYLPCCPRLATTVFVFLLFITFRCKSVAVQREKHRWGEGAHQYQHN